MEKNLSDGNKKKVLCIASMASNLDNFNRSNVKILKNLGYDITLASNFQSDEDINSDKKIKAFITEMKSEGIHIVQIDFSRSIVRFDKHIKSYRQLYNLIKSSGYSFIHTHTPIASAIARLIAHREKVKIIYTAHGFHFYKGAPLKNWLLFYPIEKALSKWTDVLITINKEDYKRAMSRFRAKKTFYIPGVGIDTKKINNRIIDKNEKRIELGLKPDEKMILSIGELSKRKNHKAVVGALGKIADPNIKYFICGNGKLKSKLERKACKLDINLYLLGYRYDVIELIQACDLFVFPSFQEGLPVALMEAISCKVPVACSDIRGNIDLVGDFLFDPHNINEIKKIITFSIGNYKFVEKNYNNLRKFELEKVEKEMKKVYLSQQV